MTRLSADMIREAAEFLRPRIRQTPLEYSPQLSERLGQPVYLKLEFLQQTGSFKLRGAWVAARLTAEEKRLGVVSCSAGNHGKAVAYVAQQLGLKATLFVPSTVDQAKYQGMVCCGAEVIRSSFSGYDRTEELARAEAQRSGRVFISPFDHIDTMAGNGGTLAKEILDEQSTARTFIFPVGGGGLAAGLSVYVKEVMPQTTLIGCQHRDSPSLKLSLERKEAVTKLPEIETLAAGVEGGIGTQCFGYIQGCIDRVALVSEAEIKQGMRWMLEHHQYLIEPSAAAALAACLNAQSGTIHSPTVVILTGRNVSLSTIQTVL